MTRDDAWQALFAGVDPGWLAPRAGSTVLDLGSGDGRHADVLAASGLRVIAVDRELELARGLEMAEGSDRLVSDGRALALRSGSVEAATVLEVFEHVGGDGPALILAELHRVIRPGGRLLVSVPTSYSERVYGRLHPRYASNATHVRTFTKAELVELVVRAGFEVTAIEPRNLYSAATWLVHAALRTEADPVGRTLEHEWVDRWGLRVARWACRPPGLRHAVMAASRRVGKSWYVRCVRP